GKMRKLHVQQHTNNIDETVANIEKQLIVEALRETGGLQSKAARNLGITERSLWHRVKKLNIDVSRIKKAGG
ncbi:MAG TPA: helix-turn-helix domain-containing protein, partial [Planctomycetota bacterium]|nr:helix-turn-helix domain-containing protein [Planctomycetota bacterium]